MVKLFCPYCGTELKPNKGWASKFYDGYCNTCDTPIENGVAEDDDDEEEAECNGISLAEA